MSTFECPVVVIGDIKPVPNSDRLEMTTVFETTCVIQKGLFTSGSKAIYFPLDSMLPLGNPVFREALKPKEGETKTHHRLKAVRLRGTYSEGLLIPWTGLGEVGTDLAKEFGVVKYEEPERPVGKGKGATTGLTEKELTNVPRYGVEALVKYRGSIPENTLVQVTEKIHGSNARYMYGKDPHGRARLNVGSHNVWKKPLYKPLFGKKPVTKGFWLTVLLFLNKYFNRPLELMNDDWWYDTAKRLDLETKLNTPAMRNVVVYGEVFGKGIQDLTYSQNGTDFMVFDMYDTTNKMWLSPTEVEVRCMGLGLKHVPVLYVGRYIKDEIDPMRTGKSTIDNKTIREGIVVKPLFNNGEHVALKYVSEDYKTRRDGTEYH